jgi:tetratricopeptide (TPR) repeat protein
MGSIQSEILKAKQAIAANDLNRANEICLAALKAAEAGGDDPAAVRVRLDILVVLSDICKNQDRLLDNINYLRELTKGAHAIKDDEMLAKGLIRIGFVFNRMGKRDRAMDKFNEAEELAKNFKSNVQYGYALAGKSNVYWRTGQPEKAMEAAKKVLEIGLENDEYPLIAGAANLMAALWYELGDFDEALKVTMLSVETYRNTKNRSDLARALNNQGEIYKRMRDYDRAIASYEEGLSVAGPGTVKRVGYLYTNMAECQTRKGNLEGAEASLEKARKILDKSEDKYAIACLWYVRGLLENAKSGNGLESLLEAEKRMAELGVPYDLGVIRLELVRHYMKSGDKDKATETAEKAIEVLEKAGTRDLAEEVRHMIG